MADQDAGQKGCYTEHGVSGYGVAVKLTSDRPLDEGEVKSMAEAMMLTVARKCMERGARCIGHIKSHLTCEAGAVKADTIGIGHGVYSTGSLSHPVRELFVAVNSIVQGIREDEVRKATLEGIHEVADVRAVAVSTEREHSYFDEFDFTASKQEYVRKLEEQFAQEAPDGEEPGP